MYNTYQKDNLSLCLTFVTKPAKQFRKQQSHLMTI